MALYLHRNLAALARVTAKENPHYAVTSLLVRDPGDGTYRVDATDGRRLAIVRAACPEQGREYDHNPLTTLVAREDWQRAFKLRGRDKDGHVGFSADRVHFTFACGGETFTGTPQEGRFPPVESVLPAKGALVQVLVDPRLLAGLLDVVADLGMEKVHLLYYGKDKVLGLAARNHETGQFFDGLVMPLTPEKGGRP